MNKITNDKMNCLASGRYIQKMHLLDSCCSADHAAEDADGNPLLHRDDRVRDKEMPVHMMYKYGAPLISKDGSRAYTFNIEFCKDTPSEGIYYGAFGLALRGTIEEHIDAFDREWAAIRPMAAQVLGNTFCNPCYNMLFRPTDNINDNTYWPFWISLGENEDIVEVAFRAVRIIRRLYEAFFAGGIDEQNGHCCRVSLQKPCYPCTENAFARIGDNGRAQNIKTEVLRFFEWCERGLLLSRSPFYDRAWMIVESTTKFAFLVDAYFDELRKRNIYKKPTTPWKAIGNVLLKPDGFLVGEANLKMLISQIRTENSNKKINENYHYVQEKLKNYFT